MRNYYTNGFSIEFSSFNNWWTVYQYGDIVARYDSMGKSDAYRYVAARGGEWVKGY